MSDFYDLMRAINTGGSGGGGTSNYNQLSNKPSVNNVTLQGNKSLSDLGLYSKSEVDALVSGGGNIIETEIEFVEETYEEDGEEYTEYVCKFKNTEELIEKIFGEERTVTGFLKKPVLITFKRTFSMPDDYFCNSLPENYKDLYWFVVCWYNSYEFYCFLERCFPDYYWYYSGYKKYKPNGNYSSYDNAILRSSQRSYLDIDVICEEGFIIEDMMVSQGDGFCQFDKDTLNEGYHMPFLFPMNVTADEWNLDREIFIFDDYGQPIEKVSYHCAVNLPYDLLETGRVLIERNISPSSKVHSYNLGLRWADDGISREIEGYLTISDGSVISTGEYIFKIYPYPDDKDCIYIYAAGFINNIFIKNFTLIGIWNESPLEYQIYAGEEISGIDKLRLKFSFLSHGLDW